MIELGTPTNIATGNQYRDIILKNIQPKLLDELETELKIGSLPSRAVQLIDGFFADTLTKNGREKLLNLNNDNSSPNPVPLAAKIRKEIADFHKVIPPKIDGTLNYTHIEEDIGDFLFVRRTPKYGDVALSNLSVASINDCAKAWGCNRLPEVAVKTMDDFAGFSDVQPEVVNSSLKGVKDAVLRARNLQYGDVQARAVGGAITNWFTEHRPRQQIKIGIGKYER